MELRKVRWQEVLFVLVYFLSFVAFLIYGLRPAEALGADDELFIPKIGLLSEVVNIELSSGELSTPEKEVGNYSPNLNKTFLFGHSTSVFAGLRNINYEDEVFYNNKRYVVFDIKLARKENISMTEILEASDRDILVMMTCAGTLLDGGDATHRLIVSAVAR